MTKLICTKRRTASDAADGGEAALAQVGEIEAALEGGSRKGVRSGSRVVTMVTLVVRSGSLPSARTYEIPFKQAVERTGANGRERCSHFAMQKVVGSSPIIRSPKPAGNSRFF